jgi:hypothetical protein
MLKGTKPHNDSVIDRFAMYWLGSDIVQNLLREKQITLGDIGLLYLLMGRMDPNTGRVPVTARALADTYDRHLGPLKTQLGCLLRHQLIARARDEATGQRFFLIHPYLASVGGPQRRGYLWKQFTEAIDGRHLHPVPGDLDAA